MSRRDVHHHTLSGANSAAADAYENALRQFRCFVGDPLAATDQAIALAPSMTMAHVLRAWLHLLGTEQAGVAIAQASCDAAAGMPATDREARHLHAAQLLVRGRWHAAGQVLEDLSIAYPSDLLALQVGHQVDFFTGDSRMLRDRIARALPAWTPSMPGWHAVQSMYAFGLEETGDYAQAERRGRDAVAAEPRDGWGWHAVAHVMEMQNRPADGVRWLQPHADTWSHESYFAVHNWWHLALFHLEQGDTAAVLKLYDAAIAASDSTVVLDMVDASAMLWRLHLKGMDLGDRWQRAAERWLTAAPFGTYAFNDLHAMIAFVGAGRAAEQAGVLQAQQAALSGADDNAVFTRDVGASATRAIEAFGRGDHAQCVALLRPVRSRASRFGGSHAQRDLLDLTLIEAARRADDTALATALAAERSALRPSSPMARLLRQRIAPGSAAVGLEPAVDGVLKDIAPAP